MTKKSLPSPNQVKVGLSLTKFALIAGFRNKASYFFSLIFPLVFVFVFGFLGSGSSSIKIGVDESMSQTNQIYATLNIMAQQKDAPIELDRDTYDNLQKKLTEGKIAAIVKPIAGNSQTLDLVTSNSNPQGAATAQAFLRGVMSEMNLRAAQITNPTFDFSTEEISGRKYRYIDFALPGQIGFSLLGLATFGIAFPFITLRRTLVLKRIFATTVKPLTFVISQCLSRSVQAVFQALVILAVGVFAFNFQLSNGFVTVFEIMLLTVFGVLAFLGVGILISNIARDEQSLPIALNLFNLPQMLLAGVFIPTDSMPGWLQIIGNNLPLAYLVTAVRKISTEDAHLLTVWPYLLGLAIWGIISYILAAKTFKAE
jgi:ABC-2 type transport system permease protein